MPDEQAGQVFAMTDVIAKRARKLGGTTLHHPIGDITRYQRIEDNSETMVSPQPMLDDLLVDNSSAHALCDSENDVATSSLIENWIDETESRCWFLTQSIVESTLR